jgi:hypothetical protein
MRKAIQMKVMVWIEGEGDPAADFVEMTTRAMQDILSSGAAVHPELHLRVDEISEYTSDDE